MRARSNSPLAPPYIDRLCVFNRLIRPSVWPLLHGSCRFTLQCGTHVLLDFNQLAETEVSLEAFQLGLPQAF